MTVRIARSGNILVERNGERVAVVSPWGDLLWIAAGASQWDVLRVVKDYIG